MSPLPALLLERIARTKDFQLDTREVDDLTTAALLRLSDDGLVTSENYGLGWEGYKVTDRGASARSNLSVQLWVLSSKGEAAPTSSGDVALWAWLLTHGGIESRYGSEPELSPEVLHLLCCGLDWNRSGQVRDSVWSAWIGTFADNERRTCVAGQATCRCGEVSELKLVAEVESVTALLRQVLSF